MSEWVSDWVRAAWRRVEIWSVGEKVGEGHERSQLWGPLGQPWVVFTTTRAVFLTTAAPLSAFPDTSADAHAWSTCTLRHS